MSALRAVHVMEEKETQSPQAAAPVEAPPRKERSSPPEALQRSLDWLEGAGLGFQWAERFVYWWKHFGAIKALGVLVAVALPMAKCVWIPSIASGIVETVSEGYGVEIEVEDWSGDLFDLRASATGLRVIARGNYAQDEIFKARSATLDLSLWRRFKTGQWIDEIVFEDPTLYAERLLSGRWNWQDVIAPSVFENEPPPTMLAGVGAYRARTELQAEDEPWRVTVPVVRMDGLRIQWVENIPAQSGGGVIQSTRATIYIDDVQLLAKNFYRPGNDGEGPLDFSVEGRTGDGRISFNGLLNPYRAQLAALPRTLPASLRQNPRAPILATSIYLENVGIAALSTVVHEASLVPSTGTISGKIHLVVDGDDVGCLVDVTLASVRWRPRDDSPALPSRVPALARALDGLRADGRVSTPCNGSLEGGSYRAMNAIQASVTSKALEGAPPIVRAVARLDEKRLTGDAMPMTPEQLESELSQELRTAGISALRVRVGDETAALIDEALPDDLRELKPRSDPGNPITRGWKSVRNGWRKLTS